MLHAYCNYTTTLGGLLVHITKTLLTPRAARRPPPMPGHPGAERGSYALPKKKKAAQNYTDIILWYNNTLSYNAHVYMYICFATDRVL